MFSSVSAGKGQYRTYGKKNKSRPKSGLKSKDAGAFEDILQSKKDHDMWNQLQEQEFKENHEAMLRKSTGDSGRVLMESNKQESKRRESNTKSMELDRRAYNRMDFSSPDGKTSTSRTTAAPIEYGNSNKSSKKSQKLPRSPDVMSLGIPELEWEAEPDSKPGAAQKSTKSTVTSSVPVSVSASERSSDSTDVAKLISTASSRRESYYDSSNDSFDAYEASFISDASTIQQKRRSTCEFLHDSVESPQSPHDLPENRDQAQGKSEVSKKPGSRASTSTSRSGTSSRMSLTSSPSIRSFFGFKAPDRTLQETAAEILSPSSTVSKKSSFMELRKSFSSLSSSPSTFFRSPKEPTQRTNTPKKSQSLLRRSIFSNTASTQKSLNSSTQAYESSASSRPISRSSLRGTKASPQTIDRSMISLPIPVEESREKLHNKLRNSSSLWSLSQSLDTAETVAMPVEEYEQSLLAKLLSISSSTNILQFEDYIKDITRKKGSIKKLAEASFSEVFKQASMVYKIIPFGNEELDQLPIKDIIQELEITKLLNSANGFSTVISAFVVQGEYPDHLLQLWDDYNKAHKSVNYRPDYFNTTQLYCVMVMNDSGKDLESFDLWNWKEAASVFWQTVSYLADAELKYQFEHRDLHWSNLLIKAESQNSRSEGTKESTLQRNLLARTEKLMENLSIDNDEDSDIASGRQLQVTLIDFTLSRATDENGTVLYTRMDHPDFFRGKGDYQFDVYRFMRSYFRDDCMPGGSMSSMSSMSSTSTTSRPGVKSLYSVKSESTASLSSMMNSSELNWSNFCPITNVLWLHYLADKLLNNKKLTKHTLPGADDYQAYKCISMVHRTIDPRRKVFLEERNTSTSTFKDFSSANDVLQWGVEHDLCMGV